MRKATEAKISDLYYITFGGVILQEINAVISRRHLLILTPCIPVFLAIPWAITFYHRGTVTPKLYKYAFVVTRQKLYKPVISRAINGKS